LRRRKMILPQKSRLKSRQPSKRKRYHRAERPVFLELT
jgi:hypothetical protein